MATVEIVNITTSSRFYQLDTIGNAGTLFTVRVCAQYRGRGFNNRPLSKSSLNKFYKCRR